MFSPGTCSEVSSPDEADLYNCAFSDFDLDMFSNEKVFQIPAAAHGTNFNGAPLNRNPEHGRIYENTSRDGTPEHGGFYNDTSLNRSPEHGTMFTDIPVNGTPQPWTTFGNILAERTPDHGMIFGNFPPNRMVLDSHTGRREDYDVGRAHAWPSPSTGPTQYYPEDHHDPSARFYYGEMLRPGSADSTHSRRSYEPSPLRQDHQPPAGAVPDGFSSSVCSPDSLLSAHKMKMYEWLPQGDPALEKRRVRAVRAHLNRQRLTQQKESLRESLEGVRSEVSLLKAEKARRQQGIAMMEKMIQLAAGNSPVQY